jgi:hypothetical protein
MKHLRSVAVYSVAAVVTSAVLAASASAALPEFSGPFPKPFKSKSGTVIAEEEGGGGKLECAASEGTGEIVGATKGKVGLRLTGCLGEAFEEKFPCTTLGSAEGEVVTSPLVATLGYINKTKEQVGLALEGPSGAAAPLVAQFECHVNYLKRTLHFSWTGSVIGKLTPVNKKVKPANHFTLGFTQAKGKQKPSKLEGGLEDVLTGHIEEITGEPEIGLAAKDEIKFSETVEVKA